MRSRKEIEAEIKFYTQIRAAYIRSGGSPSDNPAVILMRHIFQLQWVLGSSENNIRKVAHRINAVNHLGVKHDLEPTIFETQELPIIEVKDEP